VKAILLTPAFPFCVTDLKLVSGVIESYGQKDYGFIVKEPDGPEGLKIFFGRKSLPAELQTEFHIDHLIGKHCTFDLEEVNGKPQARSMKIQIGSSQFLGTIKSFNSAKGFGFIKSSDSDRDVFFMKSEVSADLKDNIFALQGHLVQFTLDYNDKGQPQAKKLSSWISPPVDATKTRGFVPRYYGIIKSCNHHSEFGSIECKIFNCDVCLSSSHMPHGTEVGKKVTFEVQLDKDDRFHAHNVRTGYHGVVKSIGKSYGFIKCEDTYGLYNQDVYASADALAKSNCSIGNEMLFEVTVTPDGQPQAFNIQFVARGDLDETRCESECLSTAMQSQPGDLDETRCESEGLSTAVQSQQGDLDETSEVGSLAADSASTPDTLREKEVRQKELCDKTNALIAQILAQLNSTSAPDMYNLHLVPSTPCGSSYMWYNPNVAANSTSAANSTGAPITYDPRVVPSTPCGTSLMWYNPHAVTNSTGAPITYHQILAPNSASALPTPPAVFAMTASGVCAVPLQVPALGRPFAAMVPCASFANCGRPSAEAVDN
jgi:cold shock CspA family protein